MKRAHIQFDFSTFPDLYHPLLKDADLYDSSCSSIAQVFFIDKDNGYYLKCAPKGALETEAKLTRYFYQKELGPQVLSYISAEKDWLLTEKAMGEDCTYSEYLLNPCRLCDTIAELLQKLHAIDFTDCPVPNRTEHYLATVGRNYHAGRYDCTFLSDPWVFSSEKEAWEVAEKHKHLLKTDTLLHGDYCLPNIILNDWKFSKLIDLGNGGVGDKHIDLFWGVWSLAYNLKTTRYQERFLDAYGRSSIEPEMLRVIAAMEAFG